MAHLRRWLIRVPSVLFVLAALAWPLSLMVSVWVEWSVVKVQMQDNVLVVQYQELRSVPFAAERSNWEVGRVLRWGAWAGSEWGWPTVRARSVSAKSMRPAAGTGGMGYRYVTLRAPLSTVSTLAAGVLAVGYGVVRWHRWWVRRRGVCAGCGYFLQGLRGTVCPECGTETNTPGPAGPGRGDAMPGTEIRPDGSA